MESLGLVFQVIPPTIEEDWESNDLPSDLVMRLAKDKARSVSQEHEKATILAADTIVVKDGQILGKPQDYNEACNMLSLLSGSEHVVLTGMCLLNRASDFEIVDYDATTVFFRELSSQEIARYVNSGEPFDKAGGYGIQGRGALLVSGIEGCYYNVVGLPLAKLQTMLNSVGISLL
ncbi:MAG: septum formation protein Maf [Syntrophomonadaceae bacterium]|jgi:septum formation protein|nr:septum formation protein Maf [Syntrophomonadaceae bacterium]